MAIFLFSPEAKNEKENVWICFYACACAKFESPKERLVNLSIFFTCANVLVFY